ncbi:MAG: GntR family transcriptional regulator [Peptococcaceae bacterium]|nr:GntR family transcriptional regulator [Peptococcaceae bacterium]
MKTASREKTIDKSSVIPVYYQLAKIFEQDIRQGFFLPGESLPPENKIAQQYEISRMTVRQAISELISMGLVYTQKGKGTFVAKPRLDNVYFELGDSREEIKKRGMTPDIKLLQARIVRADEKLAAKLAVPQGTRCLYYRFTLSADGEPLVYETKYIVYTKQKPILETDLNDSSLSNLVSAHSDRMPVTCKRVLQAAIVNEEEAAVLGVDRNTPVFLVEQTIYDVENNPIGWGKSVYRGDRYKLTSYEGWNKEAF